MANLEDRLIKVHGIGRTKAKSLIKRGVKSKADLRKPKYFNKLGKDTQAFLKYRVDQNFSRTLATKIMKLLPDYLIPVGSFRRKAKTLSDLDFLTLIPICNLYEDLKKIANNFTFIDVYNCGSEKISMIVGHGGTNIHVDIFKSTEDEMPYALFHWTGNKNFNIRTRAQAKRLGYKLNQHGLFRLDDGKKIKVKSERDLFDILNVTYKEPWERND